MRAILANFDLNDLNTYGGLVVLGVGLGMISIPLALGVTGGLMFGLGVIGALRGGSS